MKRINLTKVLGVVLANLSTVAMTLAADTPFNTVFGVTCPDPARPELNGYECWITEVWTWSMGVIIPLSVLILTAAGVIYMTSEGDSGRIGTAKKMIIGVVSGVGLLILGRLLLSVVIGDPILGGWYF